MRVRAFAPVLQVRVEVVPVVGAVRALDADEVVDGKSAIRVALGPGVAFMLWEIESKPFASAGYFQSTTGRIKSDNCEFESLGG